MLQSDRFWRFLRTSVRLRLTCPSNFEGMPYAASSMIRPGSRLVEGTGSGAARAAPLAAKAPPVGVGVLRMKLLRLELLAMGPPPDGLSFRPAEIEYAPADSRQARCPRVKPFPQETSASCRRARCPAGASRSSLSRRAPAWRRCPGSVPADAARARRGRRARAMAGSRIADARRPP